MDERDYVIIPLETMCSSDAPYQYYTVVDAYDAPAVYGYRWRAEKAQDGRLFAVTGYAQNRVWMHRLIIEASPEMAVVHRDGNGLNNRCFDNLDLVPQDEAQVYEMEGTSSPMQIHVP